MSEPQKDKISPVSVAQAKSRLEQVKHILFKMQPVYEQYHEATEQLIGQSTKFDPQTVAKLRYNADQYELQLEEMRQELIDLDCVIKDFRTGLVDFVSIRDDEPVWLCFKRGEGELEYFHGWKDGFVGRQLIDFE